MDIRTFYHKCKWPDVEYRYDGLFCELTDDPRVESFNYSRYFRTIYKPSKYVKGELVEDRKNSYLRCPVCSTRHMGGIEHLSAKKCECGILLMVSGNWLGLYKESSW